MMFPEAHSKCREGVNCTGIGCRVHTGKTKRKTNHLRPKPNQHEGSRAAGTSNQKKRGLK